MRKFFLPVLALASMVIVTSCGTSKHRCPAYGSIENIQDDSNEDIIDLYHSSEEKS